MKTKYIIIISAIFLVSLFGIVAIAQTQVNHKTTLTRTEINLLKDRGISLANLGITNSYCTEKVCEFYVYNGAEDNVIIIGSYAVTRTSTVQEMTAKRNAVIDKKLREIINPPASIDQTRTDKLVGGIITE